MLDMARRDEGSLTYSADRGVWIGRYWVSLKTGKRSRKQVRKEQVLKIVGG